MIIAERQHLENLMQQQAVEMRMKEETVLSKSFRTLSSIATYLAGSAFALLRSTPAYRKENLSYQYLNKNTPAHYPHGFRPNDAPSTVGIESLATGLASASVGFCVLVLVISTWCLLFGTELAFRGEDEGSMTRAVDGLYAERKWAIRFFMCALASTLMSGIAYLALIIEFTEVALIPISFLFILGCTAAAYMRILVRPRFRFPEGLGKDDLTGDLYFDGGFDPEIGRNVEIREG